MERFKTFDAKFLDSAGNWLQDQATRMDPVLHLPLQNITYGRDINLRTDVDLGDTNTAFTNSNLANAGNGNWIGANTVEVPQVQNDIKPTFTPLNPWGAVLSYSVTELERAMKMGRNLSDEKMQAINQVYQNRVNRCCYLGDTTKQTKGMFNHSDLTVTNAITGSWSTATADQIRADLDALLNSVWESSGYNYAPTDLLLPPVAFSRINSTIVSSAGNQSLLTYYSNNCISAAENGRPLNIRSQKYLKGAGASNKDRAFAYTNQYDLIRFPLVPMQQVGPVQYIMFDQVVPYQASIGAVEVVRPEAFGAIDGL